MQTDPRPGHLFITRASGTGRAGALCRIVHVTDARFYVAVERWGERDGETPFRMHSIISGRRGEIPYVSRDNVFAGPVTTEEYAAYLSAFYARDDAIRAATKAVQAAYDAEIARIFGDK